MFLAEEVDEDLQRENESRFSHAATQDIDPNATGSLVSPSRPNEETSVQDSYALQQTRLEMILSKASEGATQLLRKVPWTFCVCILSVLTLPCLIGTAAGPTRHFIPASQP